MKYTAKEKVNQEKAPHFLYILNTDIGYSKG